MTNLEALKAIVQYPLDDSSFKLALINRSLAEADNYTASNLKLLELAKADCLGAILSSPDIAEGGFQLTHGNKEQLQKEMGRLYAKWGESQNIAGPRINDATNRW